MASLDIGAIQRIELLFGEIERRLHQHAQFDQLPQQFRDRSRELASQRAQRAARSAIGCGLDQVGDALGLRQVELVVEKCAAGKFTRLSRARAQLEAALEQHLHHHRTAVSLQLEHVLARVRMRRGEIKRDAIVDGGALRVEEDRPDRAARRGHLAEQRLRERRQVLAR